MSEGLWDNLEVGLLFFIIDLVVTVVILPFVLWRLEGKRWRPMRLEILEALLNCQLETVHSLEEDFKAIVAVFVSQHIIDRSGDEVRSTERARALLSHAHEKLRQVIDLLAPATEASMAGAIVEFMRLPALVSEHLSEIDEYLDDLLHFDEKRGARKIEISAPFREAVNSDIEKIRGELDHASFALGEVISRSTVSDAQKNQLNDRLLEGLDRQYEIMTAARALMEFLMHRTRYYVENRQYATIDEWLDADLLSDFHITALLEFGDAEVIAACHRRRAEAPPDR